MSGKAVGVRTMWLSALDVGISYFARVASTIAFVVVVVTAGQLMHVWRMFSMRTQLCFEGVEFKSEELIATELFGFVFVKAVTVEAQLAAVVVTFCSFIAQRVIHKLVDIMALLAFLT